MKVLMGAASQGFHGIVRMTTQRAYETSIWYTQGWFDCVGKSHVIHYFFVHTIMDFLGSNSSDPPPPSFPEVLGLRICHAV